MKQRASILALTLVLILGMSGSVAQAATTPSYLGQTSWTVTITQDETGPLTPPYMSFVVTGGITKLGDNYYQFQGVATVPGDNPVILNGGGALISGTPNQLILTCSTTQQHTGNDRDTGVMQITIDQSNFNGTFYEVGHDFTMGTPGTYSERFTAGNVTLSGSIIPLTTTVTPAVSLLLQQ